jgi:molybdopterin synthase catalytic subunit/molybdopterin synthase sulfur carrier subunit
MQIRLFARARDLAGTDALDVSLPAGATVRELRRRVGEQCPRLAGLLERCAVAVDDEFADEDLTLPLGAEVALLPPVSGG